QAHQANGVRDPRGLVLVDRIRSRRHHVAEAAAPGALRSQEQERGLAFLPALADVGAPRLLAPGGERVATHQLLELRVVGSAGETNLQPRRLACARGVHPRPVRHADDREGEAAAGGVVVAFAHLSRVYARPMASTARIAAFAAILAVAATSCRTSPSSQAASICSDLLNLRATVAFLQSPPATATVRAAR